MPQNLLSEYMMIWVARGDDVAPPYVCLTRDQQVAERRALAWATKTFEDGEYRVVGGRFVGFLQSKSWGVTI